jgi:O-antigen ligase
VLTVAAVGDRGPYVRARSAIVQRVVSTVRPDVLEESSYRDRADENRIALDALRRSPVFGVGLGQPYGARRAVYASAPPRYEYEDRLFIHNGVLGIWLQLGVLGLAGFGWLGLTVLRYVRDAARSHDPARIRQVSAGVAILAFGLQALLAIAITIRPTIVALSLALTLAAPADDEAPPRDDAASAEA